MAVAGLNAIVLATSDRPIDDPLAAFAAANELALFRGDPDDVAGRALACAERFGLDYFARVNGDSPFLEPALLGEAIRRATTDALWLKVPFSTRTRISAPTRTAKSRGRRKRSCASADTAAQRTRSEQVNQRCMGARSPRSLARSTRRDAEVAGDHRGGWEKRTAKHFWPKQRH